MQRFIFIAFLLIFSVNLFAQDKQDILKVLDTQRMAWNKGDLESFMQSYWKSDSLLFVGEGGPKYGWQTTLDNYKSSYPDKAAMGNLTFDIKEVRFITPNDAFVLGAWSLKRQSDNPKGFFTLLLRRIQDQWIIVSDHSS